jgi:hypothetical protein
MEGKGNFRPVEVWKCLIYEDRVMKERRKKRKFKT